MMHEEECVCSGPLGDAVWYRNIHTCPPLSVENELPGCMQKYSPLNWIQALAGKLKLPQIICYK